MMANVAENAYSDSDDSSVDSESEREGGDLDYAAARREVEAMAAYANVAVTPSTMTNLDDYAYANLDDEEFIELEAYTIVKDMIEDAFDDTKMGDPDVIMRACFIMDSQNICS